jgi:hypothetical protein
MECPQHYRATNHRMIQWRVTNLYGARCVGVGEDAVKNVSSWADKRKFRDAECADTTYVGARRPCTAFLERRVGRSFARNVIAQPFTT